MAKIHCPGVFVLNPKYKGILFTVASAAIFGFTPILTRIAYEGGANGVTMTFLRAVIALPVLWFIIHRRGLPLRVTPGELKGVTLAGILGSGATCIMLYMSYNYISVGLATTLHFIYPLLVAGACVLLFHERMNFWKVFALAAGMAGIVLSVDFASPGGVTGMALALLSGVTYTFYIIHVDKSGLKSMYYFKLSFYLCVMMALVSGVYGLFAGALTFQLTPMAWFFAVLVSLFASVGALSLFQLGIRYTGASTAAILSTLEPITSIVLGVLVLREEISLLKLAGCAFILASVILITLAERKQPVSREV